jgi:phosphoglycerol transferase MdoB-like AlkP superfamily enzyme
MPAAATSVPARNPRPIALMTTENSSTATLHDRNGFYRLLERRHGGVLLFLLVFLALALLTRGALLEKAAHNVSWDASLLAAFGWGLLFDVGAAAWFALPLLVVLTLLPVRFFARRWGRAMMHMLALAVIYLLLFDAVAEWLFWDEFGVRFNFIAVDYLVYTHEVIGNIRESYPMPLILGSLGAGTLLVYALVLLTGWPARWLAAAAEPAKRRYPAGAAWCAGLIALGATLNEGWLPDFANNYNREIGKDGIWAFFAAFRNNELDYDLFYPTLPIDQAFARLHQDLREDGAVLLRPGAHDTLRYVRNPGPELKPNVIQITVESLSADFLGIFNPASTLTPNLKAIADKSLVFENFYATGTRTDRGMEALTLSLPPTPGRSLVKRPHNENLFTLGSVFRAKGYDTVFLYGGFGYFDNMNYFFGHNGYRIIDRNSVSRDDITFANIWGASDEDLFQWTLREADAEYAKGRAFHFFVMTTSNHRPYTYPEGRIDLPPKISRRAGAVKYTDYAIGKLIRDAQTKPWFRNTVFVIVADHCASSAGKTELPVQNYHIPLIIYAPGGQIAPGHIKTLAGQMDYAPTLLGLLHWSYPSRFYGRDVRRILPEQAHALIGNYQKLGELKADDEFVVLKPVRSVAFYVYDPVARTLSVRPFDKAAERGTIAFYQTASYLYRRGDDRELTPQEFSGAARQVETLARRPTTASR